MKSNQIFSLKRFYSYSISSLMLRYRQLLWLCGATAAGIYFSSMFFMNNSRSWTNNEWSAFSFFAFVVTALLFIGSAFPALRSKEKSITFFMTPASTTEKFVYELAERLLLFLIVFPILLTLFGNFAIETLRVIRSTYGHTLNAESLSIANMLTIIPAKVYKVIIPTILSVASLAFAGTVVFKRLPLIKTAIFAGSVFLLILGYFYVMMEKMHLRHPWIAGMEEKQIFNLFMIIGLCAMISILAYAFFKLKEKEIS